MIIMNEVLIARENRSLLVKSRFRGFPLIIVKANIAGVDKNVKIAYFLVDYFHKLVIDKFKVVNKEFFESHDGPYWLLEIENNGFIKEDLIKIEETHPIGRLIDLDVYLNCDKSLSRSDFNKGFRKCLICDKDAVLCIKNRTHTVKEIHNKMHSMILDFLSSEIKESVFDAITKEAKLEDKFGLVTYTSEGSHPDMDYSLLEKSKNVILNDLVLMFEYGYNYDLLVAFKKSRELGKITETKMFQVTNGINTYKGLIFVLGITLVALGNSFKDNDLLLYSRISEIGKGLNEDFQGNLDTYGKVAYSKYQMKGIRGEVQSGLENVKNTVKLITDDSKESLTMALIHLIANVEDTVLLKRAKSLEKYEKYKKIIGNIKTYDLDKIKKITNDCINENLSFGGSADLLVVSIFIRRVEEKFKIKYE